MTRHDAVVYDLDGTLVRLAVDWDEVRAEVRDLFEQAGVAIPDDGLWGMMATAPDHGLDGAVEAAITRHEEAGAAASDRLTLADDLARSEGPIGVCSLNAESACRIALEAHDLLAAVDAVVGRDSVATHKPDPEPLLTVIRQLNAAPAETLFIGDSERDERTADRAGTRFAYADDYARRLA